MKAIIPAAGYATRLYPITKDTPKALLEVKNKPIITHIIKKINELNAVDQIYVITNNVFFHQFEDWAAEVKTKIPIKVINDHTLSNDDRKGQVGDILYAIDEEQIDDDIMIIAGDNLFNFALKPSYDIFRAKKTNVNVLYDVADKKVARDFGIVKIDKSNKFIAFVEKPQNPDSTLASMGIMYFPKATIAKMKQYVKEGNDPDKVGCFFEWLIRKDTVYAHIHKEKWFDIGTFEGLGKARAEFAPSS